MNHRSFTGLFLVILAGGLAGCEPGLEGRISEELIEPVQDEAFITVEVEQMAFENLALDEADPSHAQWPVPKHLRPKPNWTPDCSGMEPLAAVNCAEAAFWPAFQNGLNDREDIFYQLTDVIDEHGEDFSARLLFLRALLGVAIQTENSGEDSLITPFILTMKPDLDLACELEPENDFYNTWRLSGDLILAMMLERDDLLGESKDASFEHAQSTYKNVMGIMSTWIAFPLDSGLPQQALPLMEEWLANGHLSEINNDWHRPFTIVGFKLMLGDMFARMGMKEEAVRYLNECLEDPESIEWPYRFLAEDLLDNIDSTLDAYEKLPEYEPATELMISWGEFSCRMCHGTR